MAITYFGSASNPADNGSLTTHAVAVTPPSNMLAGDLVILVAQLRYSSSFSNILMLESGGQTWFQLTGNSNTGTATNSIDTTDLGGAVFACRFNGTWSANPSVDNSYFDTIPMTVKMDVFRPTSSSYIFDMDVIPVCGTFAAGSTPFTKTIPGITTVTNGALVYAVWMSVDDNTWGSLTGGWSSAGTVQYRNTGGSDQSLACAYKIMATAGASGDVSMNQATLGGDNGATFIVAFCEVPANPFASAPAVDVYTDFENGSNGDALTLAKLNAGTHPASPGGAWSEENTPEITCSISTSGETALGNSIICGGVTYADAAGTRGLRYDHTKGSTTGYYTFALTTNKNALSMGMFYKTNLAYGGYIHFPGQGGVYNMGGGYAVGHLWSEGGADHYFGLETNSVFYWPCRIVSNKWYWLNFKYDYITGLSQLAVFDPANSFAQVGFTVKIPLSLSGQVYRTALGCTGENEDTTGDSYIDDLVMDWTNAAFPLGPGAAGGAAAQPYQPWAQLAPILAQ